MDIRINKLWNVIKKLGMKVYETDKNGSITITSDGSKDYKITTEK